MNGVTDNKIKDFFENLYEKYNDTSYISSDPVRFPHELSGNKEFIAFTASCFAYGNMKAIQGFLFRYFENVGADPLNLNYQIDEKIYYRFQKSSDVVAYSLLMKKVYEKYGSLRNLFKESGALNVDSIDKGVKLLRSHFENITNGLNFLIPIPGKSASKRLYMFLRWMVRKDNVDFGFWTEFDKSTLYMPLDTHMLRMAANLGIIDKQENDKKAVVKVTDFFKQLNPDDPAKYDFSLTRLGIVTGCKYSKTENCEMCYHYRDCLFG